MTESETGASYGGAKAGRGQWCWQSCDHGSRQKAERSLKAGGTNGKIIVLWVGGSCKLNHSFGNLHG